MEANTDRLTVTETKAERCSEAKAERNKDTAAQGWGQEGSGVSLSGCS